MSYTIKALEDYLGKELQQKIKKNCKKKLNTILKLVHDLMTTSYFPICDSCETTIPSTF